MKTILDYVDNIEKIDAPFSLDKFKINRLTPIEKYNGIYYKRDDKFVPFYDIPINGGKVRQAFCLLHNNYDYIKRRCNGIVGTASSVHSPQGIIITRVAKEFGFNTILSIGGTELDISLKHILVKKAHDLGAEIILSKYGFNNSLYSNLEKLRKKNNMFIVKFGINLDDDPNAILLSTAQQVQNIPKDLDILVVPIGSGICFSGILLGLKKYNINPKKNYWNSNVWIR